MRAFALIVLAASLAACQPGASPDPLSPGQIVHGKCGVPYTPEEDRLGVEHSCPGPNQPNQVRLVDSDLWPAQHLVPAEDICEGSEAFAACVAEVRAERVASGRKAEPLKPQ